MANRINGLAMAVSSPEKAGVGGSIPSLPPLCGSRFDLGRAIWA